MLKKIVILVLAFLHTLSGRPNVRIRRSIECDHSKLAIADIGLCVNQQLGFTHHVDERKSYHHRQRRVATKVESQLWSKNNAGYVNIPYKYDTDKQEVQTAFTNAIEVFHKKSCIRFIPKKDTHEDYISLISDYGCYSSVGRQGGRQNISLQSNSACQKTGVAVHEILHALGFYHEMKRNDRDEYVVVDYNNIWENRREQFKVLSSENTTSYGESYDKHSILHYGNYAGAIDLDKMTIKSRSNSSETLGQRDQMTETDITELNKRFECQGY